jgi:hypothetical protein
MMKLKAHDRKEWQRLQTSNASVRVVVQNTRRALNETEWPNSVLVRALLLGGLQLHALAPTLPWVCGVGSVCASRVAAVADKSGNRHAGLADQERVHSSEHDEGSLGGGERHSR